MRRDYRLQRSRQRSRRRVHQGARPKTGLAGEAHRRRGRTAWSDACTTRRKESVLRASDPGGPLDSVLSGRRTRPAQECRTSYGRPINMLGRFSHIRLCGYGHLTRNWRIFRESHCRQMLDGQPCAPAAQPASAETTSDMLSDTAVLAEQRQPQLSHHRHTAVPAPTATHNMLDLACPA